MKAARIHEFGGPEVILVEDVPAPVPASGEVLVRVAATGVGPWDALIREGKSKVAPQPPLTLGSDLVGLVEAVGPGVTEFKAGDEVYGVTNPRFYGANAEYAAALANMIAHKPRRISDIEAASVPVVAVTAWQMLFDYAHAERDQTLMILGAAGNVGAYAVQFAAKAGLHVIAVTKKDIDFVRSLGAEIALDSETATFADSVPSVDAVIDTVGGRDPETLTCRVEAGRNPRLGCLHRSLALSAGCAHSLLLCRNDNRAPEQDFKVENECAVLSRTVSGHHIFNHCKLALSIFWVQLGTNGFNWQRYVLIPFLYCGVSLSDPQTGHDFGASG
jgi:D-arabinose 1-dehydrogenase-like Zn-dependent alcohol dehydrogenase